ncbi:MAG TPA: hypothetical protein VLZ12_11370 [Verrucomicrobiae bacterium]|nr:hypothetical protein [Verrucomicrobiae bacterium]
MTRSINVEEIKRRVDYKSLAQEIIMLSQAGGLKRLTPVVELLNPVKDSLIVARQNNASIRSLAMFLQQRGVPISEASLRRYLREQMNGAKRRRTGGVHATTASKSDHKTAHACDCRLSDH